ncbi:hypothetical protein M407DRAFT_133484 [Tulasnella calospora MUT 4182]|uniref:Uncharacterized protein n=1 Tax=Tulasnella calospora MUT 4182 TaxID=1051891 RepID=A0A0C3QRP4_9AGAM|nr:hypothetical protein M407DRAFT_133484 [Tulasnella calospora MUT 4182]
MPIITHVADRDCGICRLDFGIAAGLRNSSYYLTEESNAIQIVFVREHAPGPLSGLRP